MPLYTWRGQEEPVTFANGVVCERAGTFEIQCAAGCHAVHIGNCYMRFCDSLHIRDFMQRANLKFCVKLGKSATVSQSVWWSWCTVHIISWTISRVVLTFQGSPQVWHKIFALCWSLKCTVEHCHKRILHRCYCCLHIAYWLKVTACSCCLCDHAAIHLVDLFYISTWFKWKKMKH